MNELNFRRNVDPDVRRRTNKSLIELDGLQAEYKRCKDEVDNSDKKLEIANDKLVQCTLELEKYRNLLSNSQEEIDADYLPEGAQPKERIQKRNDLQLVISMYCTFLVLESHEQEHKYACHSLPYIQCIALNHSSC
jgi:hypothetical protein